MIEFLARPTVAVAVIVVAGCFYFATLCRYAVDFPYRDDFNAILEPMLQMQAAHSYPQVLLIAMKQHNEHRLVFAKAVQFLLFRAEGRVDFRTLIVAGNLGLVALCAALLSGVRKQLPSSHVLAIAPLLIFSPLQGGQAIWAMACLSNFWVLAFAGWALFLLTQPCKWALVAACLLAVLAAFTSGQGLFCFVAGLAGLAMQRYWRKTLAWLGVFGLTTMIYFNGYAHPHDLPMEFSARSVVFFPTITGAAVSSPLCHLLDRFAGGDQAGEARSFLPLRCAIGLVMLAMVANLWVRNYHRRNSFLPAFLLYLVMLCVSASLTRSSLGLQVATDMHYNIISLLIALGLIFATLDLAGCGSSGKFFKAAMLAGAVFAGLLAWHLYTSSIARSSEHLSEQRHMFIAGQSLNAVDFSPQNEVGFDLLWQSYLLGLLPLDELDYSQDVTISPAQLHRIASLGNRERGDIAQPENKNRSRRVAALEWHGDRLSLLPPHEPRGRSAGGWIRVENGELFYLLPPHPPLASESPQ